MSFFGRKIEFDGKKLDIQKDGDLDKRVSALEDKEYERNAIANGAIMIAGLICTRGNPPPYCGLLGAYLRHHPRAKNGILIGRPEDMRGYSPKIALEWYHAEALRDWLLKEFPLEAPEAEPKKKGGK